MFIKKQSKPINPPLAINQSIKIDLHLHITV